MGDQTHRLVALLAKIQFAGHFFREPAGLLLQWQAPVVTESDHVVGPGEKTNQVVIHQAYRTIRLDLIVLPTSIGQIVEAIDQSGTDPYAVLSDLQIAAQDAG
ncbi:hypothetical protein D9M69_519990 [compost metagenome]